MRKTISLMLLAVGTVGAALTLRAKVVAESTRATCDFSIDTRQPVTEWAASGATINRSPVGFVLIVR